MENKADLSPGLFQVPKVVGNSVCRQECHEPHSRKTLVNKCVPKTLL